MVLKVQRYSDNGNSTQGLFFINHQFASYTLEDEHREVKVPGETRIPAGVYEIGFMEADTPLTLRYRRRFDWFHYHLHIKDVPNFTGIYIHIGNDEKDTAGCVTVQDNANNNQVEPGFNGRSTPAFKRIYLTVSRALKRGERVFIEICDEKDLIKRKP